VNLENMIHLDMNIAEAKEDSPLQNMESEKEEETDRLMEVV